MHVVGDLLARDRRSRDPALVTDDGRERSYHDLITNAYKAANVLRYLGVREGSTVAVAPVPDLQPTLAVLGAAGMGARVRFDPAQGIEESDRVVLVPVADEGAFDPAPGTNLAVFGGPPERPETTHWEQELWSENPGMPPADVDPSDAVIVDGGDAGEPKRDGESESGGRAAGDGVVTHEALLGAAGAVIERFDLVASSRVVVRTTFADPRAVAAGLIAPLYCGGTSVLVGPTAADGDSGGDSRGGSRGDSRGDLAIVSEKPTGEVPEPARLAVSAIDL